MKENITRIIIQCPGCFEYHNDLDGTGYCETCEPLNHYARGAKPKPPAEENDDDDQP